MQDVFAIEKGQKHTRESIKVIGVGGCGCNALDHIIISGVSGVDFVATNTDVAHLQKSQAPTKLILGEELTKGLGAGSDPDVGFEAAKESAEQIKEVIEGADMIFLTAGMGGGTGTGASPVIAELAKEAGALVVAVVTTPFAFEVDRVTVANAGINNLRDKVDALIIISNQRLMETSDMKLSALDSYRIGNDVLRQAVQGVTDLILNPGVINVDFADVRTIMLNSGTAIMGIGEGQGDDRASLAARAATSSPLMEYPMDHAKGILFNVTGASNVGIHEIQEVASVIKETAGEGARIIWGHVINDDLGDAIRITVIATGVRGKDEDPPVSKTRSRETSSQAMKTPARPLRKRPAVELEEVEVRPESHEDLFRISGVPSDKLDEPAVIRRKRNQS